MPTYEQLLELIPKSKLREFENWLKERKLKLMKRITVFEYKYRIGYGEEIKEIDKVLKKLEAFTSATCRECKYFKDGICYLDGVIIADPDHHACADFTRATTEY